MTTPKKSAGISRRLMLTIGILGTAGAVAGLGTYAQFTDSTTANHAVSTGTVDIALGTSGTSANRFSESSTLLAAGDTIQRAVDVNVAGTLALASVKLTAAATTSTALDTDATDGLQLLVQECSAAWTEAGAANARTYTCGGTTTTAIASGPVIQANSTMSLSSLTPGDKHLMFKWTLPATAVQPTHSGLSSAITYTFDGVQRAATNK